MKIDHIEVYGFEAAIRGMRNPRDSQSKSDSTFGSNWSDGDWIATERARIGPEDLRLMRTLISRGGSHRKFLRMIQIWCDLTLPVFMWADMDTYKVATVKNCQSSASTLRKAKLTHDHFEGLDPRILEVIHEYSAKYRENPNAETYHALKCQLTQGFYQTATYSFNYEVALSIYNDRKSHVLPEFSGPGGICEMIAGLPYMQELMA